MAKLLKLLLLLILFSSPALAAKRQSNMMASAKQEKYLLDAEPTSIRKTFAKELHEIENYLNSFQTLSAKFKQSSHEEISYGNFFISKPGKIRYEYLEPSSILILIDGDRLTYYDKDIDEVSRTSADINALKLLAFSKINFADLQITAMEKEKQFINICLKENSKELKQDLYMTLKFSYPHIELKQLNISTDSTDDSDINLILENIVYNQPLGKDLFYLRRDFTKSRSRR